jgi:hypothetical protein
LAPRYLIFDRGANFNRHVTDTIKSFGIQPKRTSFQSPWQNGIADRFVGSCRRDLLDHVIVVNEYHLKRLMKNLISYYHDDRTHIGLGKETPAGRKADENPGPDCRVVSIPRLGGLHHRYRLAAQPLLLRTTDPGLDHGKRMRDGYRNPRDHRPSRSLHRET